LPVLLVTAVITPGLIISLVGIYLVSQQKNARLLNLQNQFASRMALIAGQVETGAREQVDRVFQQVETNAVNLAGTDQLLEHIKTIVLENPIVQYPFFIDSQKEFLFPFSRKAPVSQLQTPAFTGRILRPQASAHYTRGYGLEYSQRNFTEAIRAYGKSLRANPVNPVKPYIHHSIARCYFKANRFPQAIHYYMKIRLDYPAALEKDPLLHFTILRQLALCHRRLEDDKNALQFYLELYEKTTGFDAPGKTNPYAFYNNEALDYLNRHIRQTPGEQVGMKKQLERLKQTPELDVSLQWLYFESQGPGETGQVEEPGHTVKFLKLRELYEANDEKTRFYKLVKTALPWPGPKTAGVNIERLKNPLSNTAFHIAVKPLSGDRSRPNRIYFGFMISIDYIRETLAPQAALRHLDYPPAVITLAGPGKPGLLSVPFQDLFTGSTLTLYTGRPDFFQAIVRQDIRLYYILLLALIAALTLGVLLIFKYLAREAELVRLKSRFVDSVSHTLKTPLTRISLLAENMARGWVTDESRKKEFFDTIIAETGRMGELVDNMLNFSRIEAGKQYYEKQKTYLQEILGSVIDHYSGHLKNQGFQPVIEIDDSVPPLDADPAALRLIVSNLLQNAVKYSLTEKYIRIRVYREGDWTVLEIEDRGIGIPRSQIPHIFKKFHRVPHNAVKSIEGSGLGLYLVRHAVEAHDGKIKIESAEGSGTVIRVYFP
jgi:signal transduction histidine kinase/tetratricopeptide (TPR) repeat protein